VGLIAGVTPAIERYQAMDQALGERFVNYRIAPADREKQVEKAMENVGREKEMRHETAWPCSSSCSGSGLHPRTESPFRGRT
jgi:hypothetical protein